MCVCIFISVEVLDMQKFHESPPKKALVLKSCLHPGMWLHPLCRAGGRSVISVDPQVENIPSDSELPIKIG